MRTLQERLRHVMAGPPKVSQAALARACGIKPPSVNDWLSGKTKSIEGENLLNAAAFLKVLPLWLATGKGPMRDGSYEKQFDLQMATGAGKTRIALLSDPRQEKAARERDELLKSLNEIQAVALSGKVIDGQHRISLNSIRNEIVEGRKPSYWLRPEDPKPASSLVAAMNDDDYAFVTQYAAALEGGTGSHNDHVEIKGTLAFKKAWLKAKRLRADKLMVIYADGVSMQPTINAGDVILLDETRKDPVDGELFGLKLPNGNDIVKRLRKDSKTGEWLITSDNPEFKPFGFADEDGLEVKILGRVVWRGGDL